FPNSRAMDHSSVWDFLIPERWTTPARGILQFPIGGPVPRVGFPNSRVMDCSRAWDFPILEQWTVPAREISQFLSDGPLPRVRIHESRAMDYFTHYFIKELS
ncbi:MAG TPA: hypothetical protein H9808_09045, partial [Candidatus Atopostipes pullistercoris]|nr:hypothetical protein [Candidatus Atopostipes pullistercoris]